MVNAVNVAENVTIDRSSDDPSHTVACIDIQISDGGTPSARPSAFEFVLAQVNRAVRADDRVCPMATSRLAVQFGEVATGVLPQVLGDRLARAVGQSLPFGAAPTTLAVSVGMAEPEPRLGASDLTRRALSAAQAGSSQLGRRPFAGTQAAQSVVTVDRLLAPCPAASSPGLTFQSIHRRSVYRYDAGRTRGVPTLLSGSTAPDRPEGSGARTVVDRSILVIDPMGSDRGEPGLAATTAAAVVERLGCRTAVVATSPDDPLALAIDGAELDVVVLVLDGGWVGHSPTWASGAWGVPARLTASYRTAGIPVLATSTGAGVGAVSSCVAQGAVALFSLDLLPDALQAMGRLQGDELLQAAEAGYSARVPGPRGPHRQRTPGALLSDRRVGGPGHRPGAGGVTHHGALPHPFGAEEARGPVATGGGRHRQQPRPPAPRPRRPVVRDAVRAGGKVVLLAGPGDTTHIVANYLADRVTDLVVVVEDSPSRRRLATRRAARIGWPTVIGQILFVAGALPLLRHRGRARIESIVAGAGLDVTPTTAALHAVPSVNDRATIALLRSEQPDVVVVNGTRIISSEVLGAIGCPIINTHAGFTPRYRGVHGGYWALAEGHPELVGTTVHLVDQGIDTGGVLARAVFDTTPDDSIATYPYLHLVAGLPLLAEQVRGVLAGRTPEPLVEEIPPDGSRLYLHPTLSQYLWSRLDRGVR